MDLPPGLVYLLRNLPYFAIPSAVTYASVKVLLHQTNISLSTLVVVLFSLLARPILFLCNIYYSEWADKRAAAAHGAVIAPKVDDPLLSIVSKMAESFRGGYPGMSFHLKISIQLISDMPHELQLTYTSNGRRNMAILIGSIF